MAERSQGYIYRNARASAEELRVLLGGLPHGWAWTPASMDTLAGAGDPLACDEGRAYNREVEVRWRRTGAAYDVLVLALREQTLAGFEPVLPVGGRWDVAPTDYLLNTGVHPEAATAFHDPTGSIRFIALITGQERRMP